MYTANAPLYRSPRATDRIRHATNTTQRTETQRTAHRYAQTAQRTARSQSCGLSTGTYGYQTRHTHGRYVPPPGLPGRRSASATLLLPHTEQTRVPGAGHAACLRCLPLMSLIGSARKNEFRVHRLTFPVTVTGRQGNANRSLVSGVS